MRWRAVSEGGIAIKPAPAATAPPPAALPIWLQRALENAAGPGAAHAGAGTAALLTSLIRLQDELGTGLFIVDSGQHPVYASPALLRILGRDLDAFLALASATEVFAPAYRAQFDERGRDAEVTPTTYESKLVRIDGTFVDVELSSLPLKIGEKSLTLHLLRDITRRKQTQRLARVGTWDWHMKDDTVEASDEAWSILGRPQPRHPIASAEFWSSIHPEDRPQVLATLRTPRTKPGPFTLDYRITRRDGTTRFVHVEGAAVATDTGIELSGNMQDVTEVRFAEQSLQNLTKDLMRSNEELEQFAYVASHDLREPLRIIAGYLGILERRYGQQLPAEAKKFIEAAVEGAARMEQLISHMLEYSRVGTHAGDLLPIESEEAFQTAVRNVALVVRETTATITHDPLPVVVADRAQLVQLFQNFLSNALKFRGPSPPRIHVSATRHANEWEFAIKDNGIGIDEKDFERVFELFQRLHSTQEYSGSGIGLAIAKKIVERHGGRVWVDSALGQGSTFHFTLPIPV